MHLIHDINKDFAEAIFSHIDTLHIDTCRAMKQSKMHMDTDEFRNKSVISIFFEPSTRTVMSFQMAAHPMQYINLNIASSSQSKGETMLDTINTAMLMQPDFLIIRSKQDIYAEIMQKYSMETSMCTDSITARTKTNIINAGCGNISHPTQALTDCYLIKKHCMNLASANIVICGDILHSRVAQSNINLLNSMGAQVGIYSMDNIDNMDSNAKPNCIKYTSVDEFIDQADIIMLTRPQTERHNVSLDKYKAHFSMTQDMLARTKNTCKIMHAGPVNHNIEISSNVIQHEKSLIGTQVSTGIIIRRAVFYIINQIS